MGATEKTGAGQLMGVLEQVGGVITDSHFVFTSGKHGTAFVNWVAVLQNIQASLRTAEAFADIVSGLEFETVAGPGNTGDKVARDLTFALARKGQDITPVYAPKRTERRTVVVDGQSREVEIVVSGRTFPRGQKAAVADHKVLVVDDVLTTGGTLREMIAAVQEAGGIPIAVAVACNRSSLSEEFDGLPLLELLNIPMDQWEEKNCQACLAKVPMNTAVGHGREFLGQYGENPTGWPANRER